MASKTQFKMTGQDQLIRDLQNLDKGLRGKIARKAVGEGTTVQLKEVKAEASSAFRDQTKATRKSLGKKVKSYKSGMTMGVVGPRKGFRVGDHDPFYSATPLEYGKGKRGRPFMRPAAKAARERVIETIADKIASELEKLGK